MLRTGTDVTLVTYGPLVCEALDAARILAQQGIQAEIVKLWRLSPLDLTLVEQSLRKTGYLLCLEECVSSGCVGQEIAARLLEGGVPMKGLRLLNLGENFVTQGTVPQLHALMGIDGKSVAQAVKELVGFEEGTT